MFADILTTLEISAENAGTYNGDWFGSIESNTLSVTSPINHQHLAKVKTTTREQYIQVVEASRRTFLDWSILPAPKRGEIVREISNELRTQKANLAKLISIETGKILSESEGEVQEAIDIADFAVGLSRQLYGKTMHSERPGHRMYEQWHPLGPIGVISAFNFPVAVWSWNAMLAAVCGNTVIWKPSELAPLSAIATCRIVEKVTQKHGFPALFALVTDSDRSIGRQIAQDRSISLVSATGSSAMGKSVAQEVASRLGRSLLELGGNNALIVMADADLELATRAIVFGAVGTAGQRCTSTRRLIVEKNISSKLIEKLKVAYSSVKIGDPLDRSVLMGPLISKQAVKAYKTAIAESLSSGGKLLCGGNIVNNCGSNLYVEPTMILAPANLPIMQQETFAPILYIVEVDDLQQAITINNSVAQGLSSALFTGCLRNSEIFLSAKGSDCGIANVNIGTSGAEIGGAFGGEKETGGGREAGSDCWKTYMRRQTNTINWSGNLPLAQGVSFG